MKRRMKKILCVLTACVLTSGTFLNLEQAATFAYASEVSEEQRSPVTQENLDSSEAENTGEDVDTAGNTAKEILDLMGADEPLCEASYR